MQYEKDFRLEDVLRVIVKDFLKEEDSRVTLLEFQFLSLLEEQKKCVGDVIETTVRTFLDVLLDSLLKELNLVD